VNVTREPLFDAEQWRKLREAIEHLDGLPAGAREAELERIGSVDAELGRALHAFAAAPSDTMPPLAGARSASDAMRARIGSFHLLREIGAGGMGVVYLAERRGADFVQRVALKLLDGAASRMSRLAARERTILAALTHPNITAFVDAGMENGHAWLAMEYVDGEPLLEFCKQRHLDTQARVRLFDQICAAVSHAHAQLVVHRDLKPSNVLVAGDGTVKLLDFGIARVLDASDAHTPATHAFTPEYAAPEQLRGERATTTTDVYALGLMLYELVSGRRLPTLQRNAADTDWTTTALARHASAPDGSAHPATLDTRVLRGDLGRILAHALATDPARRYDTVVQLREDLRRWLEHRPLTIARPGLRYVAARFVRRNRVAVATAAIAVLALFATTVYALWQAREARQQAAEARLMAARADHARSFLDALFLNADPYSAKHDGSVADFLRDAGKRIDFEFADAPDMAITLRSTVASALLRLDQAAAARELLQRNLEQSTQLYGADSPKAAEDLATLARASEDNGEIETARHQFERAYAVLKDAGEDYARARIAVMTGLSSMALRRDDYAQAQHWTELVLHERQAREGPSSPDIVMDLMNLASDAGYQEHFSEGLALAQRAHDMLQQVLGPGHPRSVYVDNALGDAQIEAGQCAEAVKTLTAAAAVARKNLPPGARALGVVLSNLGRAQSCSGDDAAAMADSREAFDIADKAHDTKSRATIELRLGLIELRARADAALSTLDAARADLAANVQISEQSAKSLWAQAAYGDALAIHGNAAEGARLARDARDTMKAGKDRNSVMLGELDLLLADALDRQSKTADARGVRKEALAIYQRVCGDDHPQTRELAAKLGAP
jgi:serine/threonine-protein kinase